ncbi:MAG: sialate O-acetylesterase, partial [Candidatus Cryptobacteroides sp.]
QRDVPLEISGRSAPGRSVKVTLGKSTKKCTADGNGKWQVRMPALQAGTGIPFIVSDGRDTLSFSNVAAGEVWLCSGQSNMAFELGAADTFSAEGLDDPLLRLYDMKSGLKTWGLVWQEEDAGRVAQGKYYDRAEWTCSSGKTTPKFSAVGYYFGKMLRDSLDVPVGLICNAVGGTTTESFTSREALENVLPGFCDGWLEDKSVMEWARKRAQENMSAFKGGWIRHPFMPGYLYDCGIRPLKGFSVKGAVWYQGESNAENIPQHEILFKTLVDCWRQTWDNPDMPFYFVQLSSIERQTWPEFRNSQRLLADGIPHCGMAVCSDLGDRTDVHPRAKKPVGERLARLALRNDYGKQTECRAPSATKASINAEGDITVEFDSPLSVQDGTALRGFKVCLGDGSEVPATAVISGADSVCLSVNPTIGGGAAVKVRYAWEPYTDANLCGVTGLPVSTFETEIK